MNIEQKTINTVRALAADMVQKANSGHPGAPMGMAPMAYALWMQTMNYDPKQPQWADRDRFVLSNGHASALLYSMLHLTGYDLPMDQLRQFRQWQSMTPGHPEYRHTPGVETTTGPLGQGFSNAVGLAIAETMLAAHFNRPGYEIVDHHTYAFAGDGCLMEGISAEAASLAGTLKLNKLVVLYDDNEISIEGNTDIAFKENVGQRFESYGWRVIRVEDGNQYEQEAQALRSAQESDRPVLIICPTIIGYGSAAKQGTSAAHGEPLGADNLLEAKKALGLGDGSFAVDDDVYLHAAEQVKARSEKARRWQKLFEDYRKDYPELAAEWDEWHSELDLQKLMKEASLWETAGKSEATRSSSGTVLNRLAKIIPNLVGGSADLAPSNKTNISGGGDYSAENRSGRNMHFGVREHAMGAIANGMALHGGLRVFCATFFVFSDYMKAAMRLSAIMQLPVVYVLTHDSIGVGEDGATHQPIEHLAALRATPGMQVFRPCDYTETAWAWITALTSHAPSSLVLTRQNLPQYQSKVEDIERGAYVLSASRGEAKALLMASGSEVSIAMEAQKQLREEGIETSVISVPSMEVFLRQSSDYQNEVMPADNRRRVAVEAGATMPWYRFVGLDGKVIGLDRYGASAPQEVLYREFGLTAQSLIDAVKSL